MTNRNLYNIVENARIDREIDEYAEARKAAGIDPAPKDEYPENHEHDHEDMLVFYAADIAIAVGCFVVVIALFMGVLA